MSSILYLARYADERLLSMGLAEPSHSLTRKVQGLCSVLNRAGNRTLVLATRLRARGDCKSHVYRSGKIIVLVPATGPAYIGSLGRYLYSIVSSAVIVFKVSRRSQVRLLLWDVLPDSVLPIMLACRSFSKSAVLDIEEFISLDPDAGALFKTFEVICLKVLKFRKIVSAFSIGENNYGIKSDLVIAGFSVIDAKEERTFEIRRRLLPIASSKTTSIVYSGRLDLTRGLEEFLSMAAVTDGDNRFIYIVTGFGDACTVASVARRIGQMPNVIFKGDLSRYDFMETLCSCDVGFSFLSGEQFQSASFPSKLIEYLSWLPVTISNIDVDVEMPGRIFLTNEVFDTTESYSMLENIHANIVALRGEYMSRLDASNPHSIEGFFKTNRSKLKEIFG